MRAPIPASARDWKPLVGYYEAFAHTRKESLGELMDKSDKSLAPFADPLRSNLIMQDVLSSAREENYTAALRWSLRQLEIGQVADILNVASPRFRRKRRRAKWVCDIETGVPEGHEGKGGRVDMAIYFQGGLIAAIEIKTKEYTDFDTKKHVGYCKWAQGKGGVVEPEMIFIAKADLDIDLHGFRFMSWSDVTVGLRKNAQYVIKNHEYTTSATYLAFIGAVEQNLLDFGPPENVTHYVAVRQAGHLETALGKESR